jgi:hypothetical protein
MSRIPSLRLALITSMSALLLATGGLVAAAPPPEPLASERGELVVNDQRAPNIASIMIADNIAPGWSGSTDIDVANPGASDGALRFCIQNVVNEDFDCSDPEDNCQDGQLGANLLLTLAEGDSTIWRGSASVEAMAEAGWLDLRGLDAGATRRFRLAAELPMSAGNDVMSDRVTFDIVFSLEGDDPSPGPTDDPEDPTPGPSAGNPTAVLGAEALATAVPAAEVPAPPQPEVVVLGASAAKAGELPPPAAALLLAGLGLLGLAFVLSRRDSGSLRHGQPDAAD